MVKTTHKPIEPKLLTLDMRFQDLANTTVLTSDNELKLFTNEVEENLIDPYGEKVGYITLKRTIVKQSYGLIWLATITLWGGAANLLGAPILRPKTKIEAEIRIYDKNNRLIGKYTGGGEGKAFVAFYYGYNPKDAKNKAFNNALLQAFNEIRPKIQGDVVRLNQELKSAK
jgi:hypothetical protein